MKTRDGLITFALILFLAVSFVGCGAPQDQVVEVEEVKVPVSTENPIKGTVTRYYETTGTVHADEESYLGFPAGGRIIRMNVDRGDYVNAGDILAEVDSKSFRESLNMASASYNTAVDAVEAQRAALQVTNNQYEDAKNRFDQIDADYNRFVGLYEDQVITRKEFEDIETAWKSAKLALKSASDAVTAGELQVEIAKGQVKSASAMVDQASKALADTILRAPYDGIVSEKLLDVGSNSGSAESVLKLTSDGVRKLVLSIPEEFHSLVDVGDKVEVSINHLGEEVIPLEIAVVTNDVSEHSRTFYVELEFPEELDVLPGAFCTANMILERIEDTMTIPNSAILSFNDKQGVFVNDGGTARVKFIEVGILEGEIAQVISGLGWNDKVVVVGNRFLNDGAKVEETGDSTETVNTGSNDESMNQEREG